MLNIIECTRQIPQQNHLASNVSSAKIEKPWSTFLNIWNIVIISVLISLSTCPIVCVFSESVSINYFFSSLCFLACLVIFHWISVTVNFILLGAGHFLYFFKHSWALFWTNSSYLDTIRVCQLVFKLRWDQSNCSLGMIFPPYWINSLR